MISTKLNETCDFLFSKTKIKPAVGMILGSGLGSFVDALDVDVTLPYSDVPHFVPPTVDGHGGNLVFGTLGETPVVVLQGRVHFYEGHPMTDVVYPARTLCRLGISTLVLTNSAGGMLDGMKPADLMIITDHINLMGVNPLVGPNDPNLGPRFPDMTETYSKRLVEKMEVAFKKVGVPYHKGVYCGLTGPTYETPAEIRYLKSIGGGAAGMSTVPEAIAANHMGVDVCGVSCITNLAAGISPNKLSHDEVTENAALAAQNFEKFLVEFVTSL